MIDLTLQEFLLERELPSVVTGGKSSVRMFIMEFSQKERLEKLPANTNGVGSEAPDAALENFREAAGHARTGRGCVALAGAGPQGGVYLKRTFWFFVSLA